MKMIFSTFLACLMVANFGRAEVTVSPKEAGEIPVDAYVYGYSLITTEVTQVQMSNVLTIEGLTGPMGQFINVERSPARSIAVCLLRTRIGE